MKILFVYDCLSAGCGAHIAAGLLIRELQKRGHRVDIAYALPPDNTIKEEFQGVKFINFGRIYRSFFGVFRWILTRLFAMRMFPVFMIDPFCLRRRVMLKYDVVCVPSEESYFKPLVAALPDNIRKVILIHTDYEAWIKLGGADARFKTAGDASIFRRMTAIGVVGKIGAEQLKKIFPDCKNKIYPFYNIINDDSFEVKADPDIEIGDAVRLITLARIEDSASKDFERMIRIAASLKKEGCRFKWCVFGGNGEVVEAYRAKVSLLGLSDFLILKGFSKEARNELRKSDLFILLSHYEGLPNVIYEALLRGIPVASTNVGGILEQIPNLAYGWLFPDDENAILEGLKSVINSPESIKNAKSSLVTYSYDNDKVADDIEKLIIG